MPAAPKAGACGVLVCVAIPQCYFLRYSSGVFPFLRDADGVYVLRKVKTDRLYADPLKTACAPIHYSVRLPQRSDRLAAA